MTTEATLECTCVGTCGGYFRFVGYRGEATEKLAYDAGESSMQARQRDAVVVLLLYLSPKTATVPGDVDQVIPVLQTFPTISQAHASAGVVWRLNMRKTGKGGRDESDAEKMPPCRLCGGERGLTITACA